MRCHAISLVLFLSAVTLAWAGEKTSTPVVAFEWFTYQGEEPYYAASPPAGTFYNPILPGFYPDPSVTRVGDHYYLVNSSFAWFPGIPIFHSRDLVNWIQLGHVLDRPSQLNLDGMTVSRGIFAPTIEHHEGVFYVITTLVDGGGTFLVTARDPSKPWSDPVWLPEVEGIDPSLFFDEDGRAWIVNNGPPPDGEALYEGHRAIWIQEFDPRQQTTVGARRIIVNGGVNLAERPVWIEGPHLFKRDEWYYLTCAEGGTAEDHRQVIFRSRSLDEPFEPWTRNPILTQKDIDRSRAHSVTCTGHADLVETPEGEWWAVFLGCRPYEDNYYNTGRETFLLPVTWTEDGWPMILEPGLPVPLTIPLLAGAPKAVEGGAMPHDPKRGEHPGRATAGQAGSPPHAAGARPSERTQDARDTAGAAPMASGNFTWKDDFSNNELEHAWAMLRTPRERWWKVGGKHEALRLQARSAPMTGKEQPSFLARRQQHAHFTAMTEVEVPSRPGVDAGIVALLDESHYFFLGLRKGSQGCGEVFLERADGTVDTLIERPLKEGGAMHLRIVAKGRPYTFAWSTDGQRWHELAELDGSILSPAHAWNFTGTMLGLYARLAEKE